MIRDGALAGGESARRAFSRLWRAYYRRLSVFAASWRGLPVSEREDAVSEALIAAFSGLAGYDPLRPLTPWVYRVAASRFSDAAGRARRAVCLSYPEGPEPEAPEDPARRIEERDLADRCRKAIAELPEGDRRIAHLRFLEGLSSQDIGRALGLPAGTVRWRIHAIRRAVALAAGEGA